MTPKILFFGLATMIVGAVSYHFILACQAVIEQSGGRSIVAIWLAIMAFGTLAGTAFFGFCFAGAIFYEYLKDL